jgi:hypothetical protein
MATKIVEWDDFTGGYYVGASATKQPRNTFTGQNVTVAMDDATLVPMYTPTKRTLTGTDTSGGNIVNANWTNLGPPAIINGCVCFVAKTASAAYLYVINANSVVTRHTLTVVSVANFVPLRPTAVSVSPSTSDFFVYIAGDYRQLIRLRLDTTGALVGSATNITIASMAATGDSQVYGTVIWGARMVAWSTTANIHFSNAADFATWSATNYITIGFAEDDVTACIPRNYDLIVGKPSGWYVVTGVLNYSASVRQVNNGIGIITNGYTNTDPVAEWNNQVVFNTDTGTIGFPVNLYTVNGARVQPMAFQRFSGNVQTLNMAKGPLGVLQVAHTIDDEADVTGMVYMLNQQGRWSRITIPTGTAAVTGNSVAYYPAAAATSRSYYWTSPNCQILESNITTATVALHTVAINVFEPGTDASGNPSTGTVLLADYMSQTPITVTDVYVEVELTELYSVYTYQGDASISCAVNMKFPPADLAFSVGNVSSTTLSAGNYDPASIPGTGTRFMGRVFRFRPDNPGYGYGFEVQVNFAGMKVRRVMAVLKEQM